MTEQNKNWFVFRQLGLRPCCWQGWSVLILFVGLIAAASWYVPQRFYTASISSLSITLVAICVWKGDRKR